MANFEGVANSDDNTFMPKYKTAGKSYFGDLDEESACNYYGLLTPHPHELAELLEKISL